MRVEFIIAGSLLAVAAQAQGPPRDGSFEVDFARISGDAETTVFERPRFSDGNDLVAAGTATVAETESGGRIYELVGELRVVLGNTELLGERGTFVFNSAYELVRAEISGSPVQLSDFDPATDTRFSGSADTISLDNELTTARLLGPAILSRRSGQREPVDYEGCDWIYNWGNHSFTAGTPDCGVRLILGPLRDEAGTDSQSESP
jgi:hypothetical protein